MTVPPAFPYPGYPPGPYPPPRTNALAIASLVCAFLCAPLGILFGHLSLSQIKRSGEDGRAMAIAGLVVGYVVTLGTILFMVAAMVLASLAARIVQEPPYGTDFPPTVPSTAQRALPPFEPPPGLGSACSYPATATPATKPVDPPRGGRVSPEPPTIDATMATSGGAIELTLDNAQAPCTVNSFVSLARQGYFDGTPCHRLTAGPVTNILQCGDPSGKGNGGPGYRFDNEYPTNQYRRFDPALQLPVLYPRGTLAMANAGPNSNGSQFFLVYRDSLLPPTYTVFGRIEDPGLATLDRLVSAGVKSGGDDGEPATPVTITSVSVK